MDVLGLKIRMTNVARVRLLSLFIWFFKHSSSLTNMNRSRIVPLVRFTPFLFLYLNKWLLPVAECPAWSTSDRPWLPLGRGGAQVLEVSEERCI